MIETNLKSWDSKNIRKLFKFLDRTKTSVSVIMLLVVAGGFSFPF
jgi:hypothetical protein